MKEYRLSIIDAHGNAYDILGGDDLAVVYKEWSDTSGYESEGRIVITGWGDCADRRSLSMAMDRETVKGMILERLL